MSVGDMQISKITKHCLEMKDLSLLDVPWHVCVHPLIRHFLSFSLCIYLSSQKNREREKERGQKKGRCAMKLRKLDPLGPSPPSLNSLGLSLCLMDVLRWPSHPWCLAINMSRRQRQKEHCFTGTSNLSPHSFSSSHTFFLWLTSHFFSLMENDRSRRGRASEVTRCHSAVVPFTAAEEWCLPGIPFHW